MQIANVPVSCHNCHSMAYGRDSSYRQGNKIIIECVWVCSGCGQVTKRHSEERPIDVKQEQQR